jgi:hypothetical protein
MKFTGFVFILYTVLNSINIVNSQPTISYKESTNMSLPKEYIHVHNTPRPPAPISITIPSPIPTHPPPPCCNYPPPPSPQITNEPAIANVNAPVPNDPVPNAHVPNAPVPNAPASPAPINSIYLTPTCQNMF